MSEDPYIIVNEDVTKTLGITRGLLQRWVDIQQDDSSIVLQEEFDWTTKELLNSLKSLEWDLEDLEEAFSIVEKNPRKFKVDGCELSIRRQLIEKVKKEFMGIQEQIHIPYGRDKDVDRTARQPLLEESHMNIPGNSQIINNSISNVGPFGNTKYSRLQNQLDSPSFNHGFDPDELSSSSSPNHPRILNSPGNNAKMTHDEESVMLDDMNSQTGLNDLKIGGSSDRLWNCLRNHKSQVWWIGFGITSTIVILGIILVVELGLIT